jgi:cysteine desulfurase
MIYLDNNSTTSIDPRVYEVMTECLQGDKFGNPSSVHCYGRQAKQALVTSRRTIAEYIGVKTSEVIFCSGGTEALNMVIKGMFRGGHVISTGLEHSAVYNVLKRLPNAEVEYLEVGEHGAVTVDQVKKAIRDDTTMICLSAVNTETGVRTDIEAIAREVGDITFIVDGVGLLGRAPVNIPDGVSAMCFSGHKFHAPKGVGFAFVRSNKQMTPLLLGGGHEYGKRSGTENIPGVVALAEAVKVLSPDVFDEILSLRQRLEEGILSRVQSAVVNGSGPRISNTVNISFLETEGESLVMNLDMAGVAVSHGSACTSGMLEPSRVLLSMGLAPERAQAAVRFSVSRMNTEEEIDQAIDVLCRVIEQMK